MKALILISFALLALSGCGKQVYSCEQTFDLADGAKVALQYSYNNGECSAITTAVLNGQQIQDCNPATPKQIEVIDAKGTVNKLTFNEGECK